MAQDQCPKTTVPRLMSQDHCPKTTVPRPMSQDQCPKTTFPRPMSQDQCPKTNVPRLFRTKTALVEDCSKAALSQDYPKTVLPQDCPQSAMSQDFFGTVPRLVTECLHIGSLLLRCGDYWTTVPFTTT